MAFRSTAWGLTEAQPENNVIRIVLEALGVTLSKQARARSLCSFRPGTRPSACRARGISSGRFVIQQILAYETDLLEYEDIFDGSHVIEAQTAS